MREFADGHHIEEDLTKDALPAIADDLPPGRRDDPEKGSKRRPRRGSTADPHSTVIAVVHIVAILAFASDTMARSPTRNSIA
jgi:hypothetical protein